MSSTGPREPAARRKRVRLGELLLEARLISEEQLKSALAEQKRSGRKLGRVLIDLAIIDENALQQCLATQLQIPYVDLRTANLDPAVVQLLPESLARRFRALVLHADAKGLTVGMADPTDLFAFDELAKRLAQPLRLAVVNEGALLRVLDSSYGNTQEIRSLAHEVRAEMSEDGVDIEQLTADESSPDAPVLKLLQSMFHDAVGSRASDLHIEPCAESIRIRQRVDGRLQEQLIHGQRVAAALVTRLKLMCGLDIAEKRLPQDGRFSIKARDRSIDVRMSTMPVQHGEAVVLRLLDQGTGAMTFENLGMPPEMLARFRTLFGHSTGMILVTGPTGSGKTTTLYTAIHELNQPDVKIITVEDPVEYRIERVNQVQVNAKIGLDFGRVLRSALRHDPDVILVGEMRDAETVEIGLRAAMTGHLVLSTLHTMSSPAAIERLIDMGAPGYMIAASVHGILGQRLVRRVCEDCCAPASPNPNQLAWLAAHVGSDRAARLRFRAGAGCTYCHFTGFRGRIAIFELLDMGSALADLVRRGALADFARMAHSQRGYVPLALAAIEHASAGVTSLAEAMRVTSVAADTSSARPAPGAELDGPDTARLIAG